MSSSSSWGTPERSEGNITQSCGDKPIDTSISSLEAVQIYESSNDSYSNTGIKFDSIEDEDSFLYGNSNSVEENVLNVNPVETKKLLEEKLPSEWSDEENDNACFAHRKVLEWNSAGNQSDSDDLEESKVLERALESKQPPSDTIPVLHAPEEIKYSQTERFLKEKDLLDGAGKKELRTPNASENISVAKATANLENKRKENENPSNKYSDQNFENKEEGELSDDDDSLGAYSAFPKESNSEGNYPDCNNFDEFSKVSRSNFASKKPLSDPVSILDVSDKVEYSHTEAFLKTKDVIIGDDVRKKLRSITPFEKTNATRKLPTASLENMQKVNKSQNLAQKKYNYQKSESREVPVLYARQPLFGSTSETTTSKEEMLSKEIPLSSFKPQSLADVKQSCERRSEKTVVLKHSKIISQTENIVVKTCDKASNAFLGPSHRSLSKVAVNNINNYLKSSLSKSSTQREYMQELKRSFNFDTEYGPCSSSSKFPDALSNVELFAESTVDLKRSVKYEDLRGKIISSLKEKNNSKYSEKTKCTAHNRSPRRHSRDKSESYHRSLRCSSVGRSRNRRRCSRDKSCSSPRSHSRDKSVSYHRCSRDCSRVRFRSRHRSLGRHSRYKSRSCHRTSRHSSPDKSSYDSSPRRYSRKYSRGRQKSPSRRKYSSSRSRSRDRVLKKHHSSRYRYHRSESSETAISSKQRRKRYYGRRRSHSRSHSRRSFDSSFSSLSFGSTPHKK